MNRDKVKKRFSDYIQMYNTSDPKVALKIVHSNRVAQLTEEISKSIREPQSVDSCFCWIIGLLHDIGRFEQYRRFGTFIDSESVDHAELGADILFGEGLINELLPEQITDMGQERERRIIELAIRFHNKLSLPDNLDNQEETICSVLRDADKIDIFRVIQEIPFDVRMFRREGPDDIPARDDVMKCVEEHVCVPKFHNRTEFECHIAGCAMAFELVFPKSIELARNQGYLRQMLLYEPENTEQNKQMDILRKELSIYLNEEELR